MLFKGSCLDYAKSHFVRVIVFFKTEFSHNYLQMTIMGTKQAWNITVNDSLFECSSRPSNFILEQIHNSKQLLNTLSDNPHLCKGTMSKIGLNELKKWKKNKRNSIFTFSNSMQLWLWENTAAWLETTNKQNVHLTHLRMYSIKITCPSCNRHKISVGDSSHSVNHNLIEQVLVEWRHGLILALG